MAPTLMASVLGKRNCGGVFYSDGYDCNGSGWNNWGRWVALGVIIAAAILLALAISCMNNRRRRRRGAPPMYGTGWLPTPGYGKYGQGGQNGQYYSNQPYHGGAPAPPYEAPINNQTTGNTFNSNDGYYGNSGHGLQPGIELQQPTNAYQPQRGGDPVYDAPSGPPPGKGEYVVR